VRAGGRSERVGLLGRRRSLGGGPLGPSGRAAERAHGVFGTIPGRERYLRLNHRLARRIVEAHTAWLDEVERELG